MSLIKILCLQDPRDLLLEDLRPESEVQDLIESLYHNLCLLIRYTAEVRDDYFYDVRHYLVEPWIQQLTHTRRLNVTEAQAFDILC